MFLRLYVPCDLGALTVLCELDLQPASCDEKNLFRAEAVDGGELREKVGRGLFFALLSTAF